MIDIDDLVRSIALDREHQMRAVRAALDALLNHGRQGVILADEVGCGKTYEALGTAALLWRHFQGTSRPIERILVVAEPALIHKWFDEIEAPADQKGRGFQQYVADPKWEGFLGLLKQVTRIGKGFEDGKSSAEVPPGRVYIAKPLLLAAENDSAASPFMQRLRRTAWDLVIVDEAHHFTGLHTRRSRVFFPAGTVESRSEGLTARFILGLTATPFQLSTSEMLNLLRIVHADDRDIDMLRDALPRYENALSEFYARRRFAPTDEARRRFVDRLFALRTVNASNGQYPETPGLQPLLRRYLLRNVKEAGQREYSMTERQNGTHSPKPFGKLDDLRPLIAKSPLIPLQGNHAWLYLQLRDLVTDAQDAARAADREDVRPTFVSGDIRQCLSSYEQLLGSKLARRADLPRAAVLRGTIDKLRAADNPHPKVAALCDVVDHILELEIQKVRERPGRGLSKILIFNTLMKTASTLKDALERTVERRVDPFIDEQLAAAGWSSRDQARALVREALRKERNEVRHKLRDKFHGDHLTIDRELAAGAGIDMTDDKRELVDVLFDRAEHHCTQPLFLLRMALALPKDDGPPDLMSVHFFLMQRVGQRLYLAMEKIVDDYLDDTPKQGDPFSEENRERARRDIGRIARILGAPAYVARFDGQANDLDREQRRENFNRPYAPLVLLVSKVGEEGIDLQQHTRYLLHYDVEWNPAKMEQREGRVDREGRRTKSEGGVHVQFFLLKDTYEERVFHTVMQRDASFQILIGSKKQELAKGVDDDPEQPTSIDYGAEETGALTTQERERVMIDLRP